MDIGLLFLRASMSNEERFLPYAFEGPWTDDEKSVIVAAIDPHVPAKVDAMFNNWMFWKHVYSDDYVRFSARRATREMLWGTTTAAEMAERITNYYTR